MSNVGNGVPIIFKPASQDTKRHDNAVDQLIEKCKNLAVENPASVIQNKNQERLRQTGYMEQTVLFLRHLGDGQLDEFVQHLTLCRVDFYIPSTKVVLINLHGVHCAALVRLFHYAEIPIPTTMKQGAFSLLISYHPGQGARGQNAGL